MDKISNIVMMARLDWSLDSKYSCSGKMKKKKKIISGKKIMVAA
ncbi:MAG: hypothetical protein ACTSYF_04600 [Promethearchaeota archaeon]